MTAVAVLAGVLGPVRAAAAATAPPSVLRLLAQSTTVEPDGRFEMTVALDTPAPPDAELHVAVHSRLMSRSLFEEALGDQRGSVTSSFAFPLADLQAGREAVRLGAHTDRLALDRSRARVHARNRVQVAVGDPDEAAAGGDPVGTRLKLDGVERDGIELGGAAAATAAAATAAATATAATGREGGGIGEGKGG